MQRLNDRHRQELEASAISDDVILARGYQTIDNPCDLPAAFADSQRRTGLLIPIQDVAGTIATYQLKPDDPRLDPKSGKKVKYETAAHGRTCLDVPSSVRPLLRDTRKPLWITEGAKKVDSALSNGIECIIGLQGVWNWLSEKTRLPDWDEIALKGREVVIAFDSDVMTKDSVRTAIVRFARWLTEMQGARVRYLLLPDLPDGGKCGLDDYFANGGTRADLDDLIVDHLPERVPVFPEGILPDAIDAYVTAQARAIGVPVEAVAVPLLVFAGGVIGNAVALQLKRGFSVLPTLWAGMVAPPASKKTPALLAAQWPVNALQKTLYNAWQVEMVAFEADLQAWEATPKAERGARPHPPRHDHVYTTDATVEALVDMLSAGRGVSVIRDELSGFIGAMDKYRGKGDDRQQYLSLWAGAPIKADRKGGGSVYATNPVGCVYGGIQPDLARELHSRTGARDGMIERFLLFYPDVVRTGWTEDEIDSGLLDSVVKVFEHLRRIQPAAMTDRANGVERVTVNLDPEAKRVWVDWYDANDAAVAATRGLRQGFYGKLDSQVARIALILHCLHRPEDPSPMLSAETMRAAIAVVEFFRLHLDRILPLIGDRSPGEPAGLSARILRYLRTDELQDDDGWVRRGQLIHKLGNIAADDLAAELADLEQGCVIESRTIRGSTKPIEQWRIRTTDGSKYSNYSKFPDSNELVPRDSSNTSNSSNGQFVDRVLAGSEPNGHREVTRENVLNAIWEEGA